MNSKPKIGILRWEEGHVPKGLLQLETLKGNSTNPASYPFEMNMVHVPGANTGSIILHPSEEVLNHMIDISKELIEDGVCAIATSCGFNAIFQEKLKESLDVPVLSSALLQIPLIQNIIGKDKSIGVITANSKALTDEHFRQCGVAEDTNTYMMGMENSKEWNKIFEYPDDSFDMDKVTEEVIATAVKGVKDCGNMGAILLECTDLPPFAESIREKTGLPVFDFISMLAWMGLSLGEYRF